MKFITICLFCGCVFMISCATTRSHNNTELERELSISFAIKIGKHLGSDVPVTYASMSEQHNPVTYTPLVMSYLINRSPRSWFYNENKVHVEKSLESDAKNIRVYDAGSINHHLKIATKRKWNESEVKSLWNPHAVFGPVYRIDELGEVITTIRFIVDDSSYFAYEWIAIHRKYDEGKWMIIEMACISSYKNWTVFVNEAYVDPR